MWLKFLWYTHLSDSRDPMHPVWVFFFFFFCISAQRGCLASVGQKECKTSLHTRNKKKTCVFGTIWLVEFTRLRKMFHFKEQHGGHGITSAVLPLFGITPAIFFRSSLLRFIFSFFSKFHYFRKQVHPYRLINTFVPGGSPWVAPLSAAARLCHWANEPVKLNRDASARNELSPVESHKLSFDRRRRGALDWLAGSGFFLWMPYSLLSTHTHQRQCCCFYGGCFMEPSPPSSCVRVFELFGFLLQTTDKYTVVVVDG